MPYLAGIVGDWGKQVAKKFSVGGTFSDAETQTWDFKHAEQWLSAIHTLALSDWKCVECCFLVSKNLT